jgi:ABC-type multidrug transport system ATPase subunit
VYLLGMDRIFCTKINLKINIGEKVALLGPNGAGKSTIALLSANFLFPNSGQVIFNGVAYKRSSSLHRKKIGIVLTNPYLIDKMKVEEYWRFVGGVLEVSNADLNSENELFTLIRYPDMDGKHKIIKH